MGWVLAAGPRSRTSRQRCVRRHRGDEPFELAANVGRARAYYDKAEDKMGVTGTHGIPLLDADNNQIVMAAGAKKIGYKECSTGNMAINSRPRDGRPATVQDGFCFQGIRSNAKWSTLNAEIPKGEATGNLEVRPQCDVLRIEHDKSGRSLGSCTLTAKAIIAGSVHALSVSPATPLKRLGSCSTRRVPCIQTAWRTLRDKWGETTCVI